MKLSCRLACSLKIMSQDIIIVLSHEPMKQ